MSTYDMLIQYETFSTRYDTYRVSYDTNNYAMDHVQLRGVHKSGWVSFEINLELNPIKLGGGEWDLSSIEQKWQL